MDTFFATKKAGKSSWKNTCCQLFVTDKGFVYIVPMTLKSEVLQAVKQSAKEIGAPDAIVSDAAAEQKLAPLWKSWEKLAPRCVSWKKERHGLTRPNSTLVWLKRQCKKIWKTPTVLLLFGIIVLSDELGSTTWWWKICSSYMDWTHTHHWLEMKVISQNYVNTSGMLGAIFEITRTSSPSIEKYLDVYSALQRVKEMRWLNGSWRLMAMAYHADPVACLRQMRCILSRNKWHEKCSINWLRGDGVHPSIHRWLPRQNRILN